MPQISNHLLAGVERILQDSEKYAQSGVRPPIRTNRSSIFKSGLEALRPSNLGKWNRLLFREKAKEKLKHSKAKNIGTPAGNLVAFSSDIGLKVLAGTATGLTTIASAGLSVGLGTLYVGLKYLYDKERKELNRLKVEYYSLHNKEKKVMKALAQLLANGELSSLAHKAEKAIVAQEKYDRERQKWTQMSAEGKSCGDSVLLAWRFLYFRKRLFESLKECNSLAELVKFEQMSHEAFAALAQNVEYMGRNIVRWWTENSHSIRVKSNHSPLANDGLLRWRTWANHGNSTRLAGYLASGRSSAKKDKILNQFGEVCTAAGYGGSVLAAKTAKNFVYTVMKMGIAKGTYAI